MKYKFDVCIHVIDKHCTYKKSQHAYLSFLTKWPNQLQPLKASNDFTWFNQATPGWPIATDKRRRKSSHLSSQCTPSHTFPRLTVRPQENNGLRHESFEVSDMFFHNISLLWSWFAKWFVSLFEDLVYGLDVTIMILSCNDIPERIQFRSKGFP